MGLCTLEVLDAIVIEVVRSSNVYLLTNSQLECRDYEGRGAAVIQLAFQRITNRVGRMGIESAGSGRVQRLLYCRNV